LENSQYLFTIYSIFFISIVLFSLLINTILLKFSTNLGVREKDNKPVLRWSSVSKPAMGGISFYMSFLISTACFSIFFQDESIFNDYQAIALICATSLAFLMGLADDAYNTRPKLKLIVQIICGVIIVIPDIYIPQPEYSTIINLFENDILNYTITVLWVVGIMNSINMLDNMDGITSITSLFIILILISYLTLNVDLSNFFLLVLIGVSASIVAFLFYNWNPAKMFMGDSGSQMLGLFIAAVSIKYLWNSKSIHGEIIESKQIIIVLLAFILPIIDTTSVVINRLSRKQSPFVGGKDHTTHHLSYLGFSDSQVTFIYLGISALSFVICIALFRFIEQWSILLTILFFIYFIIVFAILFSITQKHKDKRT